MSRLERQDTSVQTPARAAAQRSSGRGRGRGRALVALAVAGLVALGTPACVDDDLLDKELLGDYDAQTFLRNEADALRALNAAYAPSNFTPANDNRRWVLGDVASDDVVAGGDGTQADILAVDQFSFTAENENFLRQWRLGYEAITNANLVLARVPAIGGIDEGLRARILAEAQFLRGYHYLELAINFGGVPLVVTPLAPEGLTVARASEGDVYAQIERDLEAAAAVLPEGYPAGEVGRATRGAALGVLAKAHLFQADWPAVLAAVEAVDALGRYRLLADFGQLFRLSGDNNAESIWELQHASGLQPAQGNFLNVWLAPRLDNGGFGFGLPTRALLEAFAPGDPRRDVTLGYVGGTWFGGRPYLGEGLYSATDVSQKKLIEGGALGQPRSESGLNTTYLRYGDLVLMEAEAAAELGDLARARVAVNRIRSRARGDTSAVPADLPEGLAAAEVIAAVRAERRLELACEMHRFYDLRRWGIAEATLNAIGVPYREEVHRRFPIPQRELDVNVALTQNPGY